MMMFHLADSGEGEVVLLGTGSDHTDREAQAGLVANTEQARDKPVARPISTPADERSTARC
ncbi:DUF2848 family protein [Halomonas sp.]|uniref:DUF2848 family protein n=1 Tax=Halomonas sp. TaxID=1486246 RepID=UPI003457EE34